MKKFLSFACAYCIFAVVSANSQSLPKAAIADPFKIDRGSSFAASTTKPSVNSVTAPPAARAKIVSDIEQAMEIIKGNYVESSHLNDSELTKNSVSGMLAELDPHSSYYDPLEFSELLGEQDSEYSGTGS